MSDYEQLEKDISKTTGELEATLKNVKRRTTWENGVPVIEVSRDGGTTWEPDESYNFERAARTVQEVDETVGAYQPLDVSTEMSEIDRLIASIEATGGAQDRADAENQAARLLGFDTGEDLFAYTQQMQQELAGGVAGQQGLDPQQMATRRQFNERQIQDMERSAGRSLETILGDTGSSMRYLTAADNVRRQISNTALQQEVTLLQEDMLYRQQEYEALKERYGTAVAGNQQIQQAFIDDLKQNRYAAMQAMSQKVVLMTQKYQADTQALGQWVQNMYTAMEMDLGLQENVMDQMDDAYEREVRPYMDQLNAYATQATAAATMAEAQAVQAAAENDRGDSEAAGGLMMAIGGGLATFGGPPGWIVGGVIAVAGFLISLLGKG